MNSKHLTLTLTTLCLLILSVGVLVRAAGATRMVAGTMASSGGGAGSASYRLSSSVGQTSAAGISQSASYHLVGGYVPRAPMVVRVRLPLICAP